MLRDVHFTAYTVDDAGVHAEVRGLANPPQLDAQVRDPRAEHVEHLASELGLFAMGDTAEGADLADVAPPDALTDLSRASPRGRNSRVASAVGGAALVQLALLVPTPWTSRRPRAAAEPRAHAGGATRATLGA